MFVFISKWIVQDEKYYFSSIFSDFNDMHAKILVATLERTIIRAFKLCKTFKWIRQNHKIIHDHKNNVIVFVTIPYSFKLQN